MIKGVEAMGLPENVEGEPGHQDFADDRGNNMEGGVPVPAPGEDEKECIRATPGSRRRDSARNSPPTRSS